MEKPSIKRPGQAFDTAGMKYLKPTQGRTGDRLILIKLHEERLEKWMSAREYATHLDTINMDVPLEFPILSDEKGSTDEK